MKQIFEDVKVMFGENQAKLSWEVTSVVRAKIQAKNLFGWRFFIDELLTDLVGYMIQTGFRYSGGAYVACGMQSAIDHCRYCNAAKRRGMYEGCSLDEFYQVAEQRPDEKQNTEAIELVVDIQSKFGEELAKQLEPFLKGEKETLEAEVLKKCRSKEFIKWFEAYMSQE